MDLLAWGITVVFYLSCVMPLIGDFMLGKKITTYTEAIKAGAAIHFVLACFALVLFSVVWALIRITS